jgi:nicotinate dehydrogenase subunit A
MAETFELTVNGEPHTVSGPPDAPLLHALRTQLGLKAAKFGCGAGLCGACVVLVDGRPAPSCDLPLWSAAGRRITTLEGLGGPDAPHPVQAAFVAEQAAQCGYCIAGILVSAAALLAADPRPDKAAVAVALERHLCRCGVHQRVVRAIQRAAHDGTGSAA